MFDLDFDDLDLDRRDLIRIVRNMAIVDRDLLLAILESLDLSFGGDDDR